MPKNYDEKLVDEIFNACVDRRTEGWLINKKAHGQPGSYWQRQTCSPLAAYCIVVTNINTIQSDNQRFGYFVQDKVFNVAKRNLGVPKAWIHGFQVGVGSRHKSPDAEKLAAKCPYHLHSSFKCKGNSEQFAIGFWSGKEISRRLSEPAFDKKPAIKQLGKALRRAFKAGLSREDIRATVDEYMAESVLEQ